MLSTQVFTVDLRENFKHNIPQITKGYAKNIRLNDQIMSDRLA